MSIFASSAPRPFPAAAATTMSTNTYTSLHNPGVMSSFTLELGGNNRSAMRCHFQVLWPLVITPKRLIWASGRASSSLRINGPSMCPSNHPRSRYCTITSGCSWVDGMFQVVEMRGLQKANLKSVWDASHDEPSKGPVKVSPEFCLPRGKL